MKIILMRLPILLPILLVGCGREDKSNELRERLPAVAGIAAALGEDINGSTVMLAAGPEEVSGMNFCVLNPSNICLDSPVAMIFDQIRGGRAFYRVPGPVSISSDAMWLFTASLKAGEKLSQKVRFSSKNDGGVSCPSRGDTKVLKV